jgi:probable rRNA maturation factor
VIEVEVLGERLCLGDAPSQAQVHRLCALAAVSAGVEEGHIAIELVDAGRIAQLNVQHRGRSGPTDVLSFPVDEAAALDGVPRELGDVVICPEHTEDLCEAIVHGVLHLVGMDHERDDGEMLAVQAELLRWEALPASRAAEGR